MKTEQLKSEELTMFLLIDSDLTLRKFDFCDIKRKVEWINDPANNKYLHYDLPLQEDKTEKWFNSIKDSKARLDAVIEYKNQPVGLIGLLGIDEKNKKAEYYICIGEAEMKDKGVGKRASILLIDYAFNKLDLNRVYLYTEQENVAAQKLFERLGFVKEGLIQQDLIYNGKKVNRYIYGLLKEAYDNEPSVTDNKIKE